MSGQTTASLMKRPAGYGDTMLANIFRGVGQFGLFGERRDGVIKVIIRP